MADRRGNDWGARSVLPAERDSSLRFRIPGVSPSASARGLGPERAGIRNTRFARRPGGIHRQTRSFGNRSRLESRRDRKNTGLFPPIGPAPGQTQIGAPFACIFRQNVSRPPARFYGSEHSTRTRSAGVGERTHRRSPVDTAAPVFRRAESSGASGRWPAAQRPKTRHLIPLRRAAGTGRLVT